MFAPFGSYAMSIRTTYVGKGEPVVVSTIGSDYAARVTVLSGDACSSLQCVAIGSSDTSGPNTDTARTFSSAAGTRYYMRIDDEPCAINQMAATQVISRISLVEVASRGCTDAVDITSNQGYFITFANAEPWQQSCTPVTTNNFARIGSVLHHGGQLWSLLVAMLRGRGIPRVGGYAAVGL